MRKILIIFTVGVFSAEVAFVIRSLSISNQTAAHHAPDPVEMARNIEPISKPPVEEEPALEGAPEPPSEAIAQPEAEPAVKSEPEPAPKPVQKPVNKPKTATAAKPAAKPGATVMVAPEHYLQEAWRHVHLAQKQPPDEEAQWKEALNVVDRMIETHPQWVKAAENQNFQAEASGDPFPYRGTQDKVTLAEVQPLFQKYWALYHVGTAEFIRLMACDHLQDFAEAENNKRAWADYQWKKADAANLILKKYSYSQAFDPGGWMWQPMISLGDYVGPEDLRAPALALRP